MKHTLLIFVLLLISCNPINAFSSVQEENSSTINAKSYYRVYETRQNNTDGNHEIINILPLSELNSEHKTYKYEYKDKRQFPQRSYYIPSFCLPERNFIDNDNPFCNHYRPYGSNMYISF